MEENFSILLSVMTTVEGRKARLVAFEISTKGSLIVVGFQVAASILNAAIDVAQQ